MPASAEEGAMRSSLYGHARCPSRSRAVPASPTWGRDAWRLPYKLAPPVQNDRSHGDRAGGADDCSGRPETAFTRCRGHSPASTSVLLIPNLRSLRGDLRFQRIRRDIDEYLLSGRGQHLAVWRIYQREFPERLRHSLVP